MEYEERRLPFSGVSCDKKENVCKIWYVGTKDNITTEVRLVLPASKISGVTAQEKENILEDMLNSSLVII